MAKDFDLTPRDTTPVSTKYRRIQTQLPVPESIPVLEALRKDLAAFFEKRGAPTIENWRGPTKQNLTVYQSVKQ